MMDAISECEQLVLDKLNNAEQVGEAVSEADTWQLFYRKEIFTPWHDVEYDDIATQLIYKQIVQNVLTNEYQLRSVCGSLFS